MTTSFKFFRVVNGISHFAEIEVTDTVSPGLPTDWANNLSTCEKLYGDAVRQGFADALRWHIESGGEPAKLAVSKFKQSVADTNADAVRCAATAAAWKALGHSEDQLAFDFDGTWHVKLT